MPSDATLSNAVPGLLSPPRSIPSRLWERLIAPVPAPDAGEAGTPQPTTGDKLRLFGLSFLMLFVELALIRWTGANVLYLSYFSNFVLLGSFLGIGLGFLRPTICGATLFAFAAPLLAGAVAYVHFYPVQIDRTSSQIIYFGHFVPTGMPMWITLPFIFLAVAMVMATIASGVAQAFVRFKPLDAYRLDIVGSIAGIAAFTALSLFQAPPLAWGVVASLGFVAVLGSSLRPLQVVAITLLLLLLGVESAAGNTKWSPYYKVTWGGDDRFVGVSVNGIPHQVITSVQTRKETEPIYFLPYERTPGLKLDNVLIVGAGTGTDVAIALSQGARHIDAVEIDPQIYRLGRQLNPARPYQDPRVSVHIDDGRAFIERTDQRYDLVIFALPDSLTLVSGQSSLRLESYLFTEEAMRRVRGLLRPDGVFGMYNFYRESWLVDRLATTLQVVYGRPPCVDEVGNFGHEALFLAGRSPTAVTCPTTWTATTRFTQPATDNEPFLYLKQRGIPNLYWKTLLLILAVAAVAVWAYAGRLRRGRQYADLFFMGAAFLLLETKSVVQFALLFGTTWLVNALVFAGVLISVLAAVEVSRRVTFRRPARLYLWLLITLGVAWAVPPDALLRFGPLPRFVLAVLLAGAPIFLANLAFSQRFKDVATSATAFGMNLLGAILGGALEYSALLVGYRALALLAAALYGLAFLFGRSHLRGGVPASG
jgi:SAM-dependent methyltransferase